MALPKLSTESGFDKGGESDRICSASAYISVLVFKFSIQYIDGFPMICPICQSATKVTNSRNAEHGRAIKRRRLCTGCGRRFTTYERLELLGVEVVKRGGSKEVFSRHKLESGIRKALEKRPFGEEQLQKLVSSIENDIFNLGKDVVESEQVGQIVLIHLRKLDKVAYLRFASVYRNFRTPKAFQKEIQKLEKQQTVRLR